MIVVVVLAVAGIVVGAVAIAGKLLAARFARQVLQQGTGTKLWKAASCASALFSWAIILLAIEWLIVPASLAWSDTSSGNIILDVIAGGLVVSYITDRATGIRRDYWMAIHDTLSDAIAAAGSNTRRKAFNFDHIVLLSGGEAANLALSRILATP